MFWISCPCVPELLLAVSWVREVEVDSDQPCGLCLSVSSFRIYEVRALEMPEHVKVLLSQMKLLQSPGPTWKKERTDFYKSDLHTQAHTLSLSPSIPPPKKYIK